MEEEIVDFTKTEAFETELSVSDVGTAFKIVYFDDGEGSNEVEDFVIKTEAAENVECVLQDVTVDAAADSAVKSEVIQDTKDRCLQAGCFIKLEKIADVDIDEMVKSEDKIDKKSAKTSKRKAKDGPRQKRKRKRKPGEQRYDGKLKTCGYEGCDFQTTRKEQMINHTFKTHGETSNLWNCPMCSYSATRPTSVTAHMQTHLPSQRKYHPCPYKDCTYGSGRKEHLKGHLASVHGETHHLIKCERCSYTTAWPWHLKRHMSNHEPLVNKRPAERIHKCKYEGCAYIVSCKEALKSHHANKHGEVEFLKSCPFCSYTTSYTTRLKNHIGTHAAPDQRMFKCTYDGCLYSSVTKVMLYKHWANKHKETNIDVASLKYCALCNYCTHTKPELIRHIAKHTPRAKISYACDRQGCVYRANKISLRRHLAVLHGLHEKWLFCPRCPYYTTEKMRLAKHEREHDAINRRNRIHITHGSNNETMLNGPAQHQETVDQIMMNSTIKVEMECDDTDETTLNNQTMLEISIGNNGTSGQALSQHIKIELSDYEDYDETLDMLNDHKATDARKKSRVTDATNLYRENTAVNNQQKLACKHSNCAFRCMSAQSMRAHLGTSHGVTKYLRKCDRCDYTTGYMETLKRHLKTHGPIQDNNDSAEVILNRPIKSEVTDEIISLPSTESEFTMLNKSSEGNGRTMLKCRDAKKRFACKIEGCTVSYASRKSLRAHSATMHRVEKKCPMCDFTTGFSINLKKHLETHDSIVQFSDSIILKSELTDKKRFSCNNCDYSCNSKNTMHIHLASRHGEEKFLRKCSQCDYATGFAANMKRHLTTHVLNSRTDEAMLNIPMQNEVTDETMLSSVNDKKQFQCEHEGCAYSSATIRGLQVHFGMCHGVEEFLKKCTLCDYTVSNSTLLKEHYLTYHQMLLETENLSNTPEMEVDEVTGKMKLSCRRDGCGYTCGNKVSFVAHLAMVHQEELYRKKCPKCNYVTGFSHTLKKHIRNHDKIPNPDVMAKKKLWCRHEGCLYRCAADGAMRAHLISVHNEGPLPQCSVCDHKTACKTNMKKHMQTHYPIEQRQLKCHFDNCGYACVAKSLLKRHLKKHEAEQNSVQLTEADPPD